MSIHRHARSELKALARANRAFLRSYPGDRPTRQPVHTFYGGAHLYTAETPRRLGELALRSLDAYGRDPVEFARAVGLVPGLEAKPGELAWLSAQLQRDPARLQRENRSAWLALTVHQRVRAKLSREPVEDFRIDFEDGFGARSDAEEDEVAVAAARQLARALSENLLPPFIGIRIKSLNEEWTARSIKTLDLFISTLVAESGGRLPEPFIVTLPKVRVPEQPRALVRLLEVLEKRHGLKHGAISIELMIELTQTLLDAKGRSPLPALLAACEGRCFGAHLGTYDFTASCNITAAHQRMDHPLCDLAKGMMLLAYAGRGVFLSDGATNILPVGPHKDAQLSAEQLAENRAAVHSAWKLAHAHIRHSLEGGFYQGWDLHPAQLPVRYASCYAFFLESLPQAAERLKNFIAKAAHATLAGDVMDDAATGQGLLNYFLRARNCGAIEASEAEQSGLTASELELRSFAKIIRARAKRLEQA
ncbi:MAG TPA: phosphoenolpyruvate kinase [Polyangiaceae bacterium]|nr:phosphoenolpyruvate kinase [Polyangiaceae bacterium]